jgi:hypothetical protein
VWGLEFELIGDNGPADVVYAGVDTPDAGEVMAMDAVSGQIFMARGQVCVGATQKMRVIGRTSRHSEICRSAMGPPQPSTIGSNRWARLRNVRCAGGQITAVPQLIDSSIVRAHQHAAGGKKGPG